jgi:hypothetical protein
VWTRDAFVSDTANLTALWAAAVVKNRGPALCLQLALPLPVLVGPIRCVPLEPQKPRVGSGVRACRQVEPAQGVSQVGSGVGAVVLRARLGCVRCFQHRARLGSSVTPSESPTLPSRPSLRAAPTTPLDHKRCSFRFFPLVQRPSSRFGGIGIHDFTFASLLRIHSRYGPQLRSPTQGRLHPGPHALRAWVASG